MTISNTDAHKTLINVHIDTIKELPTTVDDYELYGSVITNKIVDVTGWDRQRFTIAPGADQSVAFPETGVVNLIYIATNGEVYLDIVDAGSVGFGQGGFGEGGFGGSFNEVRAFKINSMFLAEGSYKQINLKNGGVTTITVDIQAAKYDES